MELFASIWLLFRVKNLIVTYEVVFLNAPVPELLLHGVRIDVVSYAFSVDERFICNFHSLFFVDNHEPGVNKLVFTAHLLMVLSAIKHRSWNIHVLQFVPVIQESFVYFHEGVIRVVPRVPVRHSACFVWCMVNKFSTESVNVRFIQVIVPRL